MKLPHAAPLNPTLARQAAQKIDTKNASPEMRQAAQGLEAAFVEQMMHAMRDTVEPSEFSLHNTASDIYQGMLDQEYAESAARSNSLGLSEQIVDYWLRMEQQQQYNNNRNPRTGGTNEGQSNK